RNHPFLGDLTLGDVVVEMTIPETGEVVAIGEIAFTECRTVHPHAGDAERAPQLTRGYGVAFGHCERKAIAMAIVDRALRVRELGETATYPAQDEEFVLSHSDSIDASGMVQHLKLPHYVDFQATVQLLREIRAAHEARQTELAK